MIIPAILEQNFEEIEKKIKIGEDFSNNFHIDFIDGKFAKNTTFMDPTLFAKYSSNNLLEAHLMVEDPIKFIEPLAAAGFKRFIGQIEMMPSQVEFVTRGQELGEVGLALDGKTPFEKLSVPLEDLDLITFMTIDAGFSGQTFNPSYLEKIKKVPQWFEKIEIDGGINDETIVVAKNAGANIFTVNSFLFGSGNPSESYQKLKALVMG